eukprot:4441418-Pleurochrysis_carterae.AAC.1
MQQRHVNLSNERLRQRLIRAFTIKARREAAARFLTVCHMCSVEGEHTYSQLASSCRRQMAPLRCSAQGDNTAQQNVAPLVVDAHFHQES